MSLDPNGASCLIEGVTPGSYYISVVEKNSYSTSAPLTAHLKVWSPDPIHCSGGARMAGSNSNTGNIDEANSDASRMTLNNNAAINKIEIYPNPASQLVNINIVTSKDDNYSIIIYDIMGKQVYSSNKYYSIGSHEVNINLTDIPNGIYYVIAGNNDNKTSEKLIVTH